MEELRKAGALIITEVIKSLAKDMTTFLTAAAKDHYVRISKQEQIDTGEAFEEYIRNTYDTYSKSKSILYTNEDKDLYSFFVPVNLMMSSGHNIISSRDINNVIEQGKKIIITGTGGMGKTIIMKHFCVNAIEKRYRIPVFISLRWFNNLKIGDEPLEELIYAKLRDLGFKLDYTYFKYSLEGDKYIFLLDGYDELSRNIRAQLTDRILSFSQRYLNNYFIISSRQIDDIYGWESYRVLSLSPLTREQSVQLIWKLDFEYAPKKRFIDELNDEMYSKYQSFVSIPLLLSILFLTYTDSTIIPETLQDFYERAFETLLYRHDRMKPGFNRKLASELSYDEFRNAFLSFCFRTYFNDAYSFSETSLTKYLADVAQNTKKGFDTYAFKNDLVDVSCMLIRDGNEYVFVHRSFQEYFATFYVSELTDDEQRQFCYSFIHLNKRITTINKDRHLAFFSESEKVMEFLNMLYHIENKRFEYIVLQPIVKKLYKAYTERKKDIIDTVLQYLYINVDIPVVMSKEYVKKNTKKKVYSICVKDTNVEMENYISSLECYIMCYFSMLYIPDALGILDNINRIVDENRGRVSRLYQEGTQVGLPAIKIFLPQKGSESNLETSRKLLSFIKKILIRHEELVLEDNEIIAFRDLINKY